MGKAVAHNALISQEINPNMIKGKAASAAATGSRHESLLP